jgi:hypothetical protein
MLGGECQVALERITCQFVEVEASGWRAVPDGSVDIAILGGKRRMDSAPPPNDGEQRSDHHRRQDSDRQHNISRSHTVWIAHRPPYLPALMQSTNWPL